MFVLKPGTSLALVGGKPEIINNFPYKNLELLRYFFSNFSFCGLGRTPNQGLMFKRSSCYPYLMTGSRFAISATLNKHKPSIFSWFPLWTGNLPKSSFCQHHRQQHIKTTWSIALDRRVLSGLQSFQQILFDSRSNPFRNSKDLLSLLLFLTIPTTSERVVINSSGLASITAGTVFVGEI